MAGIIVPYLRLPNFQIICITNYEGLHKNVEKNTSVLSLFEKIEVPEISADETLMVLESLVPVLEKKYKVFISFPALRDIIYLTDRYLSSLTFPEKAIKVLDEVVAYVGVSTKEKIVLPKHVEKIITEKTEVPVGEINQKEKEVLLNLEKLIHQRIINQEEAVSDVSAAMRRARSEVTIRKGPIGCFLFLGPTGVGKTETSKALAQFYFGSEKTMIRLDMSEFQDTKDIPRLIGSINEMGILVNQVRENPFSLILLDEIEKSHPNILNLFLQVLDEGYLTDGFGKKVDFKNTIIIATSNAGYQIILEAIKQASEWSGVKQKLIDYLFKQRTFRPEFLNRFDAVVVFKPLNKANLLDISELMLAQLKKNLSEKGIDFVANEALKEKIVELGYNPIFGAREMRRVVQDKVENILAQALLSDKIYRGSKVEVDSDFKLIINGQKVE
jgi:ATP-dependent Clp protease ATP-binding subunit ClpC